MVVGGVRGLAIILQENEDISISSPSAGARQSERMSALGLSESSRRRKSEIQPAEGYGGDVSKALWRPWVWEVNLAWGRRFRVGSLDMMTVKPKNRNSNEYKTFVSIIITTASSIVPGTLPVISL